MYWGESNKIPRDYVLTYRLRVKYKLRVKWIVPKKMGQLRVVFFKDFVGKKTKERKYGRRVNVKLLYYFFRFIFYHDIQLIMIII